MARPIDHEGLRAAWRALAGGAADGWRTIPIMATGRLTVLAGRRLPGNEEAVIAGFTGQRMPAADLLPRGRGFAVDYVALPDGTEDHRWIGLSRKSSGSLELFMMMVVDVLGSMSLAAPEDGRTDAFHFLARIRAWQDFMQRGDEGVLGPEAEVGLVGELAMLTNLLAAGIPSADAVLSWQGPIDGLHDFAFPPGAIEVKTTVASAGFLATIGSLDQLDDTMIHPLFIGAVRLGVTADGTGLPDRVDALRTRLSDSLEARALFESRLLHAGYADKFADRYTRRFTPAGTRIMPVSNDFPRLIPSTVPLSVRRVRYDVDLDLSDSQSVALEAALNLLGVV